MTWGGYTITDGPFYAGMVATVANGNEIRRAGGGPFKGIHFTEVSPDIDDTVSTAPPTVLVSMGAGKVFIRNKALIETEDYLKGALLTSGTGANLGRLTQQAAGSARTDATVASVQDVQPDGILIQLFTPTC